MASTRKSAWSRVELVPGALGGLPTLRCYGGVLALVGSCPRPASPRAALSSPRLPLGPDLGLVGAVARPWPTRPGRFSAASEAPAFSYGGRLVVTPLNLRSGGPSGGAAPLQLGSLYSETFDASAVPKNQ
jgi:hypothetical protein